VHLRAELRAFTDAQAWIRIYRPPLTRLTLDQIDTQGTSRINGL
jgi:hypothetical protein